MVPLPICPGSLCDGSGTERKPRNLESAKLTSEKEGEERNVGGSPASRACGTDQAHPSSPSNRASAISGAGSASSSCLLSSASVAKRAKPASAAIAATVASYFTQPSERSQHSQHSKQRKVAKQGTQFNKLVRTVDRRSSNLSPATAGA